MGIHIAGKARLFSSCSHPYRGFGYVSSLGHILAGLLVCDSHSLFRGHAVGGVLEFGMKKARKYEAGEFRCYSAQCTPRRLDEKEI